MLREAKIGALVVSALVILGIGVFLVSEKRSLFARKNNYSIQFSTVVGLVPGSPAQLNGVTVGSVESIVLPALVEEQLLTVWITVDRRYADRIRQDSIARIKTLGLLGDKYIDITSGTYDSPQIPSEGMIPAAPPTDVERLIATGGDAVENVVAISYSLRTILERMEAGEGVLGELTTDSEAGKRAKEALVDLLETVQRVARKIESGEGTLARLINDDTLLAKLEGSIDRLDGILADLQEGDGALPALLHDPATKQRLDQMMDGIQQTSDNLSLLLADLQGGEGLLGRLMKDDEFADRVTADLQQLLHNLNRVSQKLAEGEGTLGMLIEDPQIYEAINDVIVGIDESDTLRWLIRNRQKKGIDKRYKEEQELLSEEDLEPSGTPRKD